MNTILKLSSLYDDESWSIPGALTIDLRSLEGCCCYCDEQATAVLEEAFPEPLPRLRWLDSGDYHYLSHLLACREKEPFHLILLDNHPDNQDPAFGGVLSCGSWVKEMRQKNPLLRDMLSIGPPDGEAGIPETVRVSHKHGWILERDGLIHNISDAGIVYSPKATYVFVMFFYHPACL